MTTHAFKELYELLTNEVIAVAPNLSANPPIYGVQPIEFMDIWRDQLASEDERIESYPSLFWSYSADYPTEGANRRSANSSKERLTARLVFENMEFDETYLNYIEGNGFLNVRGMAFLETKEAVRKALHGHSGRVVQGMTVDSEELDTSEKGKTIIVFELSATINKGICF